MLSQSLLKYVVYVDSDLNLAIEEKFAKQSNKITTLQLIW